MMSEPTHGVRGAARLWPFLLWLAVFYSAWLTIVVAGDHWGALASHWPIAAAMALGSYVAGSTPMGGGTVGFPVLTLLLDQPATLGRNFSFAVQSIGMVSASIFILARRLPLEWPMLRWAMVGALVGTPLGAAFIAPHASDLMIKLTFAVIWASFGLMHLVKLRDIVAAHGITHSKQRSDGIAGLLVGLIGGSTVAAVTGVGIDMMLYVVLVLLWRADLKIAIPTSVVIMAFTSLVGIATNTLLGTVTHEVYANWLAAAPIVALGAPLGAYMVMVMPRGPTLLIVSVLCVGQFVWTCAHERVSWLTLAVAIGAVLACNAVFAGMFAWGERRRIRPGAPVRPPGSS
jgi:uncharacterized membrane protein YfcA